MQLLDVDVNSRDRQSLPEAPNRTHLVSPSNFSFGYTNQRIEPIEGTDLKGNSNHEALTTQNTRKKGKYSK